MSVCEPAIMTRSLAASAASGRRHGGALSGKSRGFIYAEGIGSADGWEAPMATADFLGHYDQTLHYDDAWHDVRLADQVHLAPDGAARAAVWTAAALAANWSS